MTSAVNRGRLLAGAALGLGFSMLVPQQAMAQCVVAANSVTCASTTTTDTTNAGGTPAIDRNYPVNTSTAPFTGTVSSGAIVNGYGLAFTNTTGGANALNVVNNGTIQVDVGLAPSAGGTAALNITAIGATPINYSGTGDVLNLGTAGFGIQAESSGSGAMNLNIGGSVTGAPGFSTILANSTATGTGSISVTTATGEVVATDYIGIYGSINNAASAGTLGITNNAAISATTLGALDVGILAFTQGTGAVTVTNNGAIGTVADRAGAGIDADILNATSAATLLVDGTGTIYASGNGITADNSGTGATTVNYTGLIDTNGGAGIVASSTSGLLTVTGGPITTTGGNGIQTSTTTGNQIINANGVIDSNAAGIGAMSTSGTITANINANVTGGTGGVVLNSSGLKTVNVAAGRTLSATTGNEVTFNGSGSGIVNNSGTIGTTNTGTAVASGTVAVTVNNAATGTLNGVVALSAGNDTVNNSGVWNTSGVNDFGAGTDAVNNLAGGTLNIAAGTSFLGLETLSNAGTVNATAGVLFDAGNTAITNTGTFNAGGAIDLGAGTDSFANNAGGTLNVAAGTTLLGFETLTNAGTLNANSGLVFDAGNTAVTNTGTMNVQGTLDFGAGTDSFANSGAGILNVNANTTLAGLETFTNSGRINLNTFTLTGPAIAFTNSGTIDTNGNAGLAGFTTFSNAGTLDLAAGTFTVPASVFTNTGTIIADEGATTITGQTSFANSGTLRLQDGAVGDVLTINSAFAGSGLSTLSIDFNETTADRLVIIGAASGTTTVNANFVGTGSAINSDGILVVDTTSSTAGAFQLGIVTGNPLIDYALLQQGADYYLFATPDELAYQPLLVGAVTQDMWYQSADAYSSYAVLRRSDLGADRKSNIGIWGQLYGSNDRYGNKDTQTAFGMDVELDNTVKTDRRGAQVGLDFLAGDSFVVGITGGYQRAKAENRSLAGGLVGEGYNMGAYAQFGTGNGFYAGLLVKKDDNDVRLTNSVFSLADGDPDVESMGAEAEVGYRMNMGGVGVDFGAGLAYVKTEIDGFTASGLTYDFDDGKSMRGRLGVRGEFGGSLGLFADAKLFHEFEGDNELTLVSGTEFDTVEIEGRSTWGRFEAGFGSRMKPGPMLSAWVDVGDVTGLGLRGGFRF